MTQENKTENGETVEPRKFWIYEGKNNCSPFLFCFREPQKIKQEAPENFDEIKVIEKSAYNSALKRIEELEDELGYKSEDGCCWVEHGMRICAEHEVKDLRAKLQEATALIEKHKAEELRLKKQFTMSIEILYDATDTINKIEKILKDRRAAIGNGEE